jgi:endonuclease/exonuclease/phosphatase (EEP) superfamily protein YafD
MKNHIIICIAAIFLSGCRTLPQPVFNPDQPHLKVVTYNVNWGFVNPPNVVNFIAQSNADIVCLQETHRYWHATLESQLTQAYPYMVFREFGGAGGIAIMSKYKLENVKLIEPNDGWFPSLYAQAQTPVGKLQFLGVHLRPPLSDRGSVTASPITTPPISTSKSLRDS